MAFAMGPSAAALECAEEGSEAELSHMVDRINQRYDDFFKRQRELEEKDLRREKERDEIKQVRLDHEIQLELARKEYIKARKVTVIDPALERHWEAEQKAQREQNLMDARCYALRRSKVESFRSRGRRIPENKEYDLED